MVISNLAEEEVKITNRALKKSLVFLVTQKVTQEDIKVNIILFSPIKFTKTENNNIRENVGERIFP